MTRASHKKFKFTSIGKNSSIDQTLSIWRRGNSDLSGSIEIGSNVNIFGMVRMVVTDTNECANSFIKIKDNTYINHGCYLSGEGGLYIGEKVLIGPYSMFLSGGHEINDQESIYHSKLTARPIHISDDCWVGAGAKILGGVKLGRGSVVAAGAVVTRNVPDYAVVAGVPARIHSFRKHSKYSFLKKMLYKFNLIPITFPNKL
jgi:galactoside O-acetyltransferase